MFKLIYQENANKDPIVRKLQGSAAKFIELLEKIQNNNQILYGSSLAVYQLVSTLSDRDYEISKIKKLYSTNWELADKLFKDYWIMAIDLVNVLSEEVDNLTNLGRVRNTLEAQYGLQANNPMLLKKQIFNDERYKSIARNVMDSQYLFKNLNEKRIKCVNELLNELNSLLTLENALIAASKRENSLDSYDMTVNQQHLKRVIYNLEGHAELTDDLITKLDEYHGRLDALEKVIHSIEAEFRAANGSDPNFYNAITPATTYEELFNVGRNAQKSLDIEIQNLKQEIKEMERKDMRLKQKDHLIVLNHPKTLGLSSIKKTAEDLMKRNINDTTLLVTEISDCMKKENEEVEYCVDHLRAVKDIDVKKLQGHIDFIRHQQLATGNLAKYAKLMFALHAQRRKLIEKEDIMLIDKHKLQQNKELANLIATRAAMDARIKNNLSGRNVIENLYAKSISDERTGESKQLNQIMKRVIDNNNDVSRVLYDLQNQNKDLQNIGGPSALYPVSNNDLTNMRKEIEKQIEADVKIGPAAGDISIPFDTYYNANIDISRNTAEPWNAVFKSSYDPEEIGKPKIFDETDIQRFKLGPQPPAGTVALTPKIGIGSDSNYPLALSHSNIPQSGGSRHNPELRHALKSRLKNLDSFEDAAKYFGGKKVKKIQSGGSNLSYVIGKYNNLSAYTKILDELIAEKRSKLLAKLTINSSQSIKVERFKIDLVLHKRREEILKEFLTNNNLSFVNSHEKIVKNIENEFIMNNLFADIGAYQRQHALIKQISNEFDVQNSIVMKVFAVIIRLVAEDSKEYEDLHKAENKFQAKVRTMTMHSEKINVLCHPKNINLVEVVKSVNADKMDNSITTVVKATARTPEITEQKLTALGKSKSCEAAISHFDRLVRDLIKETSAFLAEMNVISNRAILIERGMMYDSTNVATPQSMAWTSKQIAQTKADVLAEIRAFINQYARSVYSTHEYVRSDIMTTNDFYLDSRLQTDITAIADELKEGSTLRTDLQNEYEKLKEINDSIAEVINAAGDFTQDLKTVGERVLILDMKLKQRAHQLNIINNILLNMDMLLNKHRMLCEQNAEFKLKKLYTQQKLDGVWKSLSVLQYDIDEKLTRMDAIRIAYNKVSITNDINERFRTFTGQLNDIVNNLLNLWKTVKEELVKTFGDNASTNLPHVGGSRKMIGGTDRIVAANNLQITTIPTRDSIKTASLENRKLIEHILTTVLAAYIAAERSHETDSLILTDNEIKELDNYLVNIVSSLNVLGEHKDVLRILHEYDEDKNSNKFHPQLQYLTKLDDKVRVLLKRQLPLDFLKIYLYQVIIKTQELYAAAAMTQSTNVLTSHTKPTSKMIYVNVNYVHSQIINLLNIIRNSRTSDLNPAFGEQHMKQIESRSEAIRKSIDQLFDKYPELGIEKPKWPLVFPITDANTDSATLKQVFNQRLEELQDDAEGVFNKFNNVIKNLSEDEYCKKMETYRMYGGGDSIENPITKGIINKAETLKAKINTINEKYTKAQFIDGKLDVIRQLVNVNYGVHGLATNLQKTCEPRIIQGYAMQARKDAAIAAKATAAAAAVGSTTGQASTASTTGQASTTGATGQAGPPPLTKPTRTAPPPPAGGQLTGLPPRPVNPPPAGRLKRLGQAITGFVGKGKGKKIVHNFTPDEQQIYDDAFESSKQDFPANDPILAGERAVDAYRATQPI